MLVQVSTPEDPADAELRALRLSLNSPVVKVESLPVGPANAAIAVHQALGALRVTLALRSERGGKLAFYTHEESGSADADRIIDAALSFAEGMGFLFDDDEVETRGDRGSREGSRIWLGFTGVEPTPGAAERRRVAVSSPVTEPAAGPPLTKFRRRVRDDLGRPRRGTRIQLLGRF